jgi:hypothetical protein
MRAQCSHENTQGFHSMDVVSDRRRNLAEWLRDMFHFNDNGAGLFVAE